MSSVGGMGLDSSGNSTPSHEVKIEEEDPLEENAFSDDPSSVGAGNSIDDHTMVRFICRLLGFFSIYNRF